MPWSPVLLVALVRGILGGVAGLALLLRILDVAAALLDFMGIAGFRVAGALVTLIVLRNGRGSSSVRTG